jgi:hypothetical protein
LKSTSNADIEKVNTLVAKATSRGVLVSALISSAATREANSKHDEVRDRVSVCGLRHSAESEYEVR